MRKIFIALFVFIGCLYSQFSTGESISEYKQANSRVRTEALCCFTEGVDNHSIISLHAEAVYPYNDDIDTEKYVGEWIPHYKIKTSTGMIFEPITTENDIIELFFEDGGLMAKVQKRRYYNSQIPGFEECEFQHVPVEINNNGIEIKYSLYTSDRSNAKYKSSDKTITNIINLQLKYQYRMIGDWWVSGDTEKIELLYFEKIH